MTKWSKYNDTSLLNNGWYYTCLLYTSRNGKRTATAALKIAVDMVEEGMLTKEEALLKVDPKQMCIRDR